MSLQKHLEKLKVTKSSGPDQLHPKYLHETAKNISTALATNFNISMETMKLTESWKEATVTLINRVAQDLPFLKPC
jgi:hypothetical protein